MATARPRAGEERRYHPGQALVAQEELPGELGLIAAMLRLAVRDAHCDREDWRQDAERFLSNGGVAWWDEALAMGGVLVAMMQAALGQQGGDGC